MEDSAKRKERLRALRMEATEDNSQHDKDQESSLASPGLLSNPFNDSSPSPTPQNNSRFDYYTDPLAAFSGNKKKGRINNINNNNSSPSPSPNGGPLFANRPRMMSPLNSSTPIKNYVQQQSPIWQPQFHSGTPQIPAAPFGSPVSRYNTPHVSSGPQYSNSPYGFSASGSSNGSFNLTPPGSQQYCSQPSPSIHHQQQQQNRSGSQPWGFSNVNSPGPGPMSHAPRFNHSPVNNGRFQQLHLQPSPHHLQQQNQSGSQNKQFFTPCNESPVPMPSAPSNDNGWPQQPVSQPSLSLQPQHEQSQNGWQGFQGSNSSNEIPLPSFNQTTNRDIFWSLQPHAQPSTPSPPPPPPPPQHQSGLQPRGYHGSAGRGSPWSDPRQNSGGRGSPWSEPGGSPSPGSGGQGVSWSDPRGNSGGRGTPWMNSRGRGGRGSGRGARVHASACERPDLFFNKYMVEDPWKDLVPILTDSLGTTGVGDSERDKSKGNYSDIDNSGSCQLGSSSSSKKPKLLQIKDDFQSGPSLAESLALALSDATGEETCS